MGLLHLSTSWQCVTWLCSLPALPTDVLQMRSLSSTMDQSSSYESLNVPRKSAASISSGISESQNKIRVHSSRLLPPAEHAAVRRWELCESICVAILYENI
jgi:hypothetical protein